MTVEPARGEDSTYTNQYCMMPLMLMRCNIDMRIVVDIKSLLMYLVKYVTKAEVKSLNFADMIHEFNTSHKQEQKIESSLSFVNKLLNKYIG